MAKYSFEFKKKIVMEYINGEGGSKFLAKKYGIPSESNIRKWVSNYKTYGDKGLIRSRNKENYSFEKKLAVVELYLSSELSYQELALQEGILHPSTIAKWVNEFKLIGPDALRPRKKGHNKTLDNINKTNNKKSIEKTSPDTSVEHVKELEDEILKLRIENAFLKELRRLRLEDEAKMRDLHESSTVSEDNSN